MASLREGKPKSSTLKIIVMKNTKTSFWDKILDLIIVSTFPKGPWIGELPEKSKK
jgi:hypothetical protein